MPQRECFPGCNLEIQITPEGTGQPGPIYHSQIDLRTTEEFNRDTRARLAELRARGVFI